MSEKINVIYFVAVPSLGIKVSVYCIDILNDKLSIRNIFNSVFKNTNTLILAIIKIIRSIYIFANYKQ